MTPGPDDPTPIARDPRRRLLDERALRDRLRGWLDRGGPVNRPPRPQDVDDEGAVPPGKGVAGDLPPWRTTLDDPPPGWAPGHTAGPVRDRCSTRPPSLLRRRDDATHSRRSASHLQRARGLDR